VGEHIAGADGNDPEGMIATHEAGGGVADGTVAARDDDGVVISTQGCLAHCCAGTRDVDALAARDRRAVVGEAAQDVLDERRAGDPGTGIFHEEEATAHAGEWPAGIG
jgi:uncharacterized protein YuzB (UPF0349 family)